MLYEEMRTFGKIGHVEKSGLLYWKMYDCFCMFVRSCRRLVMFSESSCWLNFEQQFAGKHFHLKIFKVGGESGWIKNSGVFKNCGVFF